MNKFTAYQQTLTEGAQTKLISVGDLKAGMTTSREGKDGEIKETVLSVEKKGIYYFYTVKDEKGKEHTMSDRGSKPIRIYA